MIKNWCPNYAPYINPDVEMCANYDVKNLKPCCLAGRNAGLWCHVRPDTYNKKPAIDNKYERR